MMRPVVNLSFTSDKFRRVYFNEIDQYLMDAASVPGALSCSVIEVEVEFDFVIRNTYFFTSCSRKSRRLAE